ncbi:MAG: zinc metallopeptidase [Acidobacteriota bacterium]|nr:MAG: zinc metallopeptidase [Acidobacteriota bacterium]
MRWRGRRTSENVEDRRGRRVTGGLKLGGGGLLLLVVVALLLGEDPIRLLENSGALMESAPAPRRVDQNDEEAEFVSVVLADTEETWADIFAAGGARYSPPTLVLFSEYVESACGFNSAAVGPFYCPGDGNVYIDLGFFQELSRLGANGDFARAYVLAHEVGHHVQNLMGTSREVQSLQSRMGEADSNRLSVRLELQADCYAGVWGYHADRQRQLLESGDIEEGLAAAAAIGDDRLQRMSGRGVAPDSFTHGTSEQRAYWLRLGLETGDPNQCNTFSSEAF